MEIILAGEKEKFFNEMKSFIEDNKIAQSNKNYFQVLSDGFSSFSGAINMTLLGVASKLAGASNDQFIAAIIYSNNFIYGIQSLLNTKRKLLKSLRSVMQMELMFNGYAQEEEEKEKDRIDISQIKNNDIILKNVSVEMDNKKILDDIDLSIPSGSMAYLSGASGAGKTTLMKVISGYYHPTSGEVELGGVSVENIKKTGDESIYNRIAYLSQFPYLFEGSLKENLKFGLKTELKDSQIEEILKEVGLSERFNNLDEKLLGGSGNSVNTSGGETSRIGLARVLLKIRNSDSRIVFLDEPTASVDKKTKKDIAFIINNEKLKRPNTTFIVISHDESFIEMLDCNIEVKIEKGKILEE
jgi:ABC-type multidrug transport system fused ATPase/permease subunit